MPRIFDNIDTGLIPALRETLQVSDKGDFCVNHPLYGTIFPLS